ncbi:frataxin homolog, mitochondrial-like [Anopheles ziemanni]|uniref:frataxin homolog, mitochondrial-like n=1 Tax=Anopheles coustani TaxID=139045 RepID=UPI00265AEDD9|nr:frataxin homolog, mitochondrial-like [Anopheles coustani]XP_058173863.1 frataxin homolog, mitochondrial-like [Anopheles ziemanni]
MRFLRTGGRGGKRKFPYTLSVSYEDDVDAVVLNPVMLILVCHYGLLSVRRWSSSGINPDATSLIDSVTYETVCSDTLESLCDYFEEVIEETAVLKHADVTYGDGVFTVNFGPPHGTYVINRQSPNRQIWLSSPTSGPKRYDFVPNKRTINEGYWLYRHDGVTLHQLLQQEISVIAGRKLDFLALPHSQPPKAA